MLCLPSSHDIVRENDSHTTVLSEMSFPSKTNSSSQKQPHHRHSPSPPLGKFAQIPLEESQEYASATASPGTSRRSHPMMAPSHRTSPTSDDDFGLSSTHPETIRNRTFSTSHMNAHSVSMLRMSAHTFASSNLPNLSFSHVAYNSQSSFHQVQPPQQQQQQQHDVGVIPMQAAARGLPRPQREHRRGRPNLFIVDPNDEVDSPQGPQQPHRPQGPHQQSPTATHNGSPSLLGVSQMQRSGTTHFDDDSGRGFLVEVKAPTFSPEVVLSPRLRRTTAAAAPAGAILSGPPPVPTEVDGVAPSFEDDIFATFGISPRPSSNRSGVKSSGGGETSARERSLQLHKARIEHLRGKQEASNVRQQQAQVRRQFLADHQSLRQAASWSVMMHLALSASPLYRIARDLTARRRRRLRMGGVLIYPIVMLGLRRALRRARTRRLTREESYDHPSLATLRADKILGLFPDHVLRGAARSMTLRYFFPNEGIVFVKCEDDEAYVLATGTADVMIGAAKVFTMQPGMVFGTIGMISGEPRSASIFARGEGCLVWVMKRDVFEASGDSAATAAAHEALAEVRQKNIMNVYKARLEPAALSSFPLFRGLADETLTGMLAAAVPRIVRRGSLLAEPDQPMSAVAHMILLKGRVTVRVSPTPAHLMSKFHPLHGNEERFSLAGELRNAVDLPRGKLNESVRHPALHLAGRIDPGATVRRGVRRASITPHGAEDATIHKTEYTVTAPALLNVNSLFLPGGMMRPTPFIVTAATDCDLLSLSRKTLRTLDVLELASIQQNALNTHADFLGTQTKRDVALMLLDSVAHLFAVMPSAQAVLSTLRASAVEALLGSMQMEKWVLPRGGYLSFDRANEFLLNIVLEGELEGVNSQSANGFAVWPPIAEGWFASRDAVTRSTKRTVCIRVPRRDLLTWFCRALPDPQDLRTVCSLFANSVASIGGGSLEHVLGFSTFDLDHIACPPPDESEKSFSAAGEASVRFHPSRSSRGYSISFDVSEATVAAILRPSLQQVAEQLNRFHQQRSDGPSPTSKAPTASGTPLSPGRAAKPATGGGPQPPMTPRSPQFSSSSAPKSPMLLPAPALAEHAPPALSPFTIGVSKGVAPMMATSTPSTAASPLTSRDRRRSSATSRQPLSPSILVKSPAPPLVARNDVQSPSRGGYFTEVSKMDSSSSSASAATSTKRGSLKDTANQDSGNRSPRMTFREATRMDSGNSGSSSSASLALMPPSSPHSLNPSPRTAPRHPHHQGALRTATKQNKGHRKNMSIIKTPQQNMVDAYMELRRPSSAPQPHGSTTSAVDAKPSSSALHGATSRAVTTSTSVERNLPVQLRVDLSTLRGKPRRQQPSSKPN